MLESIFWALNRGEENDALRRDVNPTPEITNDELTLLIQK